MIRGNIKLLIHIVGLTAIVIQQSDVYDFTKLPFADQFITVYTLTQMFVFGYTFQIKSLIPRAGGKSKPLSYAVLKSRIDTNFEEYDIKQYEDLLQTNRIMFAIGTLSMWQLKLLSTFSLMVLGFLRVSTVATHPLFQIHIMGFKDEGELERPWSPDEYLLKPKSGEDDHTNSSEKTDIGGASELVEEKEREEVETRRSSPRKTKGKSGKKE